MATDSKATACTCSGQVNTGLPVGQQGGPGCTSPNTNPQGFWCYVNKGVCPDGQPSQSLPTQDWSVVACSKSAPGGGGGVANPTPLTCKCAGLVNSALAGGADCQSKDTAGPSPGQTLDGWCYTEKGVCTDGKDSMAIPGMQYSYLACVGVTPPAPGQPTAPPGWTCQPSAYGAGAGDSCDCNCGAPDPDCLIPGIPVSNCLGGQVCSAGGQCQNPPPPGGGGGATGPVRGASLGCTAGAPANAPGTRRQLVNLPRIVGGVEVTPKYKHKHLVSLQRSNGFHFCGGSLIYDGTWVLTAAHCLQGAAYGQVPAALGKVVIHRHDFRLAPAAEQATEAKAYRVYNHPSYNAQTQSNDISLIKLASLNNPNAPMAAADVPPSVKGNIIKLDDGSFSQEDQLVTVAGWGALRSNGPSPQTARQVTVQFITNTKCQLNGGRAGSPNQYRGRLDNTMICAGQKDGAPGKDSCQGDSGGPLTTACIINGQPRAVLVGVVSWGFGCALANLPGVYANVNHFRNWVQQVIGADPNSFNG